MAYSYCTHAGCGYGLPEPTIAEAIEVADIYCPMGHANPCLKTPGEALLEMFERLKALELKVGLLP